jgi:hypothetical protein
MYDPIVGRFLNTDNYVQGAASTQSYNRYSYCLNNPLKYMDPSGWWEEYYAHDGAYGMDWDENYMGISSIAGYVNGHPPFTDAYNNLSKLSTQDMVDIASRGVSTVYFDNGRVASAVTAASIVSTIVNSSTSSSGESLTSHNGRLGYWTSTTSYKGEGFVPAMVKDNFIPLYNESGQYTCTASFIALGGSVDFGNYEVSSSELKERLNDFADHTGYNITIVGGDRNAARNAVVRGSKGSRHISGDAADIVVKGTSNRDVSIQSHNSGLFNTTIYYPYYNTPGALPPHVHVDLNPGHNNVLMIYKIVDGSDKYLPWNP